MYRQSINKRKYSTTPIVKVTDEGKEEIVCLITLPKKDGEVLAEYIAKILNEYFDTIDNYMELKKI